MKKTKRILSGLLILSTLLSMVSCQSLASDPTTTEEASSPLTETVESKTTAIDQYQVPDPLTWGDIQALPIAKSGMTEAEMRKLCTDYFRLELTFQWTPNKDCSYVIRTYDRKVSFKAGELYGGIPYTAPNNGGTLYFWMQYYNEETGVLDVTTISPDSLFVLLGNHCAHGAFWGWSRVINSINTRGTRTYTKKNGCIPVGPYQYDFNLEEWSTEKEEEGTFYVCEQNGAQTMYESYALCKMADGVVSTSPRSGHVQMVAENAHVVRNADGTIDGKNSYLVILEQASSHKDYQYEDGVTATICGGVDRKISFKEVMEAGYVPFTFKEFLGTDPIEDATVSLSCSNTAATYEELKGATVTTNYSISHLLFSVRDASGKEVYQQARKYTPDSTKGNAIICKSLPLNGFVGISLKGFAGKSDHTVTISCYVSTGEELTIYQGSLLAS